MPPATTNAATTCSQAAQLAERLGEPMVLGSALDYQAHAAFAAGRSEQAAALAERGLAAYQRIGYQEGLASAGTIAASLAVLAGQHDDAERLLNDAFDACQRLGHSGGIATVLEAGALLHHQRGDDRAAVRSMAASSAIRRRFGASVAPELAEPIHRLAATLRATLGSDEFARQWQYGDDTPPCRAVPSPRPTREDEAPAASAPPARA